MARRRRVQRRGEDADQRGPAVRDRAGTGLDAPGRADIREDEDAVHRRGGPRVPGYGGVPRSLRAEAVQDGRVLRQGDPDHAPHGGRGEVPRADPHLHDAGAGVPGRVPVMSFADEMRTELARALKAQADVPIAEDKIPEFHPIQPADESYSFLLNLSSWWLERFRRKLYD